MALDLSRPVAPPPPKRPSAQQKRAVAKTGEREEALNGLFQLGTAACMMTGQLADGAALATHGPNIARETAAIAEQNASFAKAIDYLTAVGPYAGLLTACMPLILQVMVNHKRLPPESLAALGVVAPEALEQQARADALRQQKAMLEEIAAREQEIEQMQQQNGKHSTLEVVQ